MKPTCATCPIQDEFTLCGDAFDRDDETFAGRPHDGNPLFAKPGDLITCARCAAVIARCVAIAKNGNREVKG